MRAIIFDSSTIINLAMNNLLWIMQPLKERYKGEFYITKSIKKEIIDRPFNIKRFKLESIQISNEIEKGTLRIYEEDLTKETEVLRSIANKIFLGKKNFLNIIDEGELSALVLAQKINAQALAIDERTTRLLIESPDTLKNIFKNKFKTNIRIEQKNLKIFKEMTKNIPIIRSVELGAIAYEQGLLDTYLSKKDKQTRKDLLDALLWAMRFKGCSVSEKEMQEIIQEELKKYIPSKK